MAYETKYKVTYHDKTKGKKLSCTIIAHSAQSAIAIFKQSTKVTKIKASDIAAYPI